MRLFIACAIILSLALGMGGCWWHHEEVAVAQPQYYPPHYPPPLK